MVVPDRIQSLPEADQIDRDELGALVDELIEAVLAVGAGLAPVHRTGLVVDSIAVKGDVLVVGLHGQLLQVRREALEVLAVGHDAL